jgi:uncharacterized protein YoxC
MSNQQDFAQELEAHMRLLRKDLNVLKVKASEGLGKNDELQEVLFDIQEKLDKFEERISALSESNSTFWPKAKSLAKKAWEDASYSIQFAKQYYLH